MSEGSRSGQQKGCCYISQARVFNLLNGLLLLDALGFAVFCAVVLAKFDEILEGAVTGIIVFSLILRIVLFLATLVGCYGFHNKDFTTLALQSLTLVFVLVLQVTGSVFVGVLAGNLESDEGFIGAVQEIDSSFDAQVFNDCCIVFLNNAVPAEELLGQFSLGDVVNDDLCQKLVDFEEETFVGNALDDSCGGVNVDFNRFQQDFSEFTEDFFEILAVFEWASSVLILLCLLFTLFQLCCVASNEGEIDIQDSPKFSDKLDRAEVKSTGIVMPPPNRAPPERKLMVPPTMKFTEGQKNIINKVSTSLRVLRPPSRPPPDLDSDKAPPSPPAKLPALKSALRSVSGGLKRSFKRRTSSPNLDSAGLGNLAKKDDTRLRPPRSTLGLEPPSPFPDNTALRKSPPLPSRWLKPNVRRMWSGFGRKSSQSSVPSHEWDDAL